MIGVMALLFIAVFVDDSEVLCLHWGVHAPLSVVFSAVVNVSLRVLPLHLDSTSTVVQTLNLTKLESIMDLKCLLLNNLHILVCLL